MHALIALAHYVYRYFNGHMWCNSREENQLITITPPIPMAKYFSSIFTVLFYSDFSTKLKSHDSIYIVCNMTKKQNSGTEKRQQYSMSVCFSTKMALAADSITFTLIIIRLSNDSETKQTLQACYKCNVNVNLQSTSSQDKSTPNVLKDIVPCKHVSSANV